jgi:class 3 adenylate cyclase/tetratricopeptide (TPR) repeat protein
VLVCPRCGQENPDGFSFCGACTAPLSTAAAQEERKIVSVLFVDLVGFTSQSDRADPEDVRATLRPYHARVKHEIERFGGTVEKFIGDAVMAVFGAPVAHEDDAERAVRAGLALLEATEELGLEVRAAVNTGEAVVLVGARPGEGEGIATGDVVNVASRLQQEAPTGGLVVGEATERATRQMIDYEPLGDVRVKGKAEAVPLWLAKGARSRFGVDVEAEAATPLIGRDDDLALLTAAYARTVRESSIQLVTITGEPGVGKTRLVSEFRGHVDALPELVFWRQGRCLPYGEGITFWALGEMVKAHAGVLESDDPTLAETKLTVAVEAVVEDVSEREWLQARLLPLAGAGGGETTTPEEAFAAWLAFLEGVASQRPLVLVFEDLHWADEALLAFVEHLVDWSNGVPLLVVCTARPELYERQSGWGGGKRNSTTIGLSPLAPDDTARLVQALLAQAVLPAETQTALLERSGGNPLYAEEFVRMLTDRGILSRGRIVAPEIPVPDSVQALIAARLDTLSPERKALLHDAAVIGKVFWAGAVAEMRDLDEAVVREGLHELARKELVRPARRSSLEGQLEYSFWHLLVRDVAYSQIPRGAKAERHRAAAVWLEGAAGERVIDHAELLAHHYVEAIALARAADEPDLSLELQAPAARFLLLAAERAQQLDLGRARDYVDRALELMPAGDPRRARALVEAAQVAWAAGSPDAERLGEEAVAAFEDQDDPVGTGEALTWLCTIRHQRGSVASAEALLAGAIELLEAEIPGRELVFAYTQRALQHMLASRSAQAIEWADRTLELAERLGIDDADELAWVLQARGVGRLELGDIDGLADLRRALGSALERGRSTQTVIAYINLAHETWLIEGPAAGLDINRAGIELGERRGAIGPVVWAKAETTWKLFELGRWDELLRTADEVIAWDAVQGGHQVGTIVRPFKARVLLHRGEVAAAEALTADFLPSAKEIADPQVLVPALGIAASVEHARGDVRAAIALVRELHTATRDRPLWLRTLQLPDALRICVATGELELAAALLPAAEGTDARSRHSLATGRAILAEARGEPETAGDLYRDAARGWAEYGFTLEHAHARLGAGRCVVTLGRDGSHDFAAAHEVYGELGVRSDFDAATASGS